MINTLDIKGFKSVREAHLECKRINLFIGEPNTGKSNILEALGFLSWCARGGTIAGYVRMAEARDLFYDGIASPGNWEIALNKEASRFAVRAQYNNGNFSFYSDKPHPFFVMGSGRGLPSLSQIQQQFGFIRFYRFQTLVNYPSEESSFLLPPKGDNLMALLYASKEMRRLAGEFFAPSGLLFVVKPHEHEIELQKQADGVAVSFPFSNSSDTLQRMVFYTAAIESNRDATLVFEEPEAHAFPYYTKHLGERIALDANKNQYFIATHNPYLLTAIWEKAPAGEVAVFATYYRDYETRVKSLTPDDMKWLFEADPFLGVSHLVEDAQ
ncbi:MAG: AAA family ATPase [Candidatus Brocadiia bacterium]